LLPLLCLLHQVIGTACGLGCLPQRILNRTLRLLGLPGQLRSELLRLTLQFLLSEDLLRLPECRVLQQLCHSLVDGVLPFRQLLRIAGIGPLRGLGESPPLLARLLSRLTGWVEGTIQKLLTRLTGRSRRLGRALCLSRFGDLPTSQIRGFLGNPLLLSR
jgi:hypothetical protein